MNLARRAVAELIGTAFLVAAVVGSGIMGDRLAAGNTAVALLANTLATGAALVALILTFGQISGAHFNPAVTLADASQGGVSWRDVPVYLSAQIVGAFAGVVTANAMFGLPLLFASHHARNGAQERLRTHGAAHVEMPRRPKVDLAQRLVVLGRDILLDAGTAVRGVGNEPDYLEVGVAARRAEPPSDDVVAKVESLREALIHDDDAR